ncbi:MAG: hypothetical protein KF684_03850 [Phycisphaeraceae bacterium]|nr:hypothetical protein [Phycisphaeraceae bacterium]
MRSVWLIVTTFALAHFLALVGVVAWLGATDRLSAERVHALRDLFAPTIAQEAATRAEREAEEARLRAEAEQESFMRGAPAPAENTIARGQSAESAHEQALSRLDREAQDLRRTFARELAQIEQSRERLARERADFEALRARLAELEGSEQFEKAVRLYQSLKPRQARDLLMTLINSGQIEQAVSYLNAMELRTASRIIAEFEDPALAASLLERVRTRGLEVAASPEP